MQKILLCLMTASKKVKNVKCKSWRGPQCSQAAILRSRGKPYLGFNDAAASMCPQVPSLRYALQLQAWPSLPSHTRYFRTSQVDSRAYRWTCSEPCLVGGSLYLMALTCNRACQSSTGPQPRMPCIRHLGVMQWAMPLGWSLYIMPLTWNRLNLVELLAIGAWTCHHASLM